LRSRLSFVLNYIWNFAVKNRKKTKKKFIIPTLNKKSLK
jgi:hypothetical protein